MEDTQPVFSVSFVIYYVSHIVHHYLTKFQFMLSSTSENNYFSQTRLLSFGQPAFVMLFDNLLGCVVCVCVRACVRACRSFVWVHAIVCVRACKNVCVRMHAGVCVLCAGEHACRSVGVYMRASMHGCDCASMQEYVCTGFDCTHSPMLTVSFGPQCSAIYQTSAHCIQFNTLWL